MTQEPKLSKLLEVLYNDKQMLEKHVKVYQEALNKIIEYIDSGNVDIGLTEYSNILRIIKQANEDIGKLK